MKIFSYREGKTPFNFMLRWDKQYGFYLYLFGLRLYWFKKVT